MYVYIFYVVEFVTVTELKFKKNVWILGKIHTHQYKYFFFYLKHQIRGKIYSTKFLFDVKNITHDTRVILYWSHNDVLIIFHPMYYFILVEEEKKCRYLQIKNLIQNNMVFLRFKFIKMCVLYTSMFLSTIYIQNISINKFFFYV